MVLLAIPSGFLQTYSPNKSLESRTVSDEIQETDKCAMK